METDKNHADKKDQNSYDILISLNKEEWESSLKNISEFFLEKIDQEQNEFFSPELFEIIQKYLYIIPLWSGIIIKNCRTVYKNNLRNIGSRLTNNPVESYFGHLKNSILLRKK